MSDYGNNSSGSFPIPRAHDLPSPEFLNRFVVPGMDSLLWPESCVRALPFNPLTAMPLLCQCWHLPSRLVLWVEGPPVVEGS